MGLWNKEMKYEMNVITIVTKLRCLALKQCMTSPSYVKELFVSSRLILRLVFVLSCSLLSDGVKYEVFVVGGN
jgi:hypothetical protein